MRHAPQEARMTSPYGGYIPPEYNRADSIGDLSAIGYGVPIREVESSEAWIRAAEGTAIQASVHAALRYQEYLQVTSSPSPAPQPSTYTPPPTPAWQPALGWQPLDINSLLDQQSHPTLQTANEATESGR
jgi:hypothetical protein